MIYTIDSEFIEDGRTIELLSLALVAEDGRELYIQNRNADTGRASIWVTTHVLPHLDHRSCRPRTRKSQLGRDVAHCAKHDCPWLWRDEIRDAVRGFLLPDPSPTFWGYYSAYDWVALCQLFGPMVDLPKGWPMYCHDLRSWLDLCGFSHITQPDDMPHHALSDARWIMETWQHYYQGEAY